MFAAAAVAAAAALTAISTTQTCDPNQINQSGIYTNVSTSITWPQYAAQRRSSLQRRKIEINKRLQKTQNNQNNLNSSATAKSKNNIQKEIEQLKLTSPQKSQQNRVNAKGSNPYQLTQNKPLEYIPQSFDKEKIQEEAWFKDLSSRVCNEFIKIHEMHNELKKTDIDLNLNAVLENPTYKNFNQIGELLNQNFIEEGDNFFATTDQSEISRLLLDYIQTHGNELADEKNFLGQFVKNMDSDKIKTVRPITAKQQKIIRSYEEKVHYRWDPKWLRIFRKRFCIPVAIVTLFFVLFTSFSPNWIYVDNKEKAGLWIYCNKTFSKIDTSTSASIVKSPFATTITKPIKPNSNEFSTLATNDKSSTLIRKLKTDKNSDIQEKLIKTEENCYLMFYFKDNHLAILFLAIVGLIFHITGFALLIIGMFFTTSNRTLYFFHSAGECLVSSALINGLDLLVFAAVVSSTAKWDPQRTYEYGYCFYVNLIIMLITLFFSSMFYLDDVVNEYSIWKIKMAERNKRKAQMFAKRKPIQ